MTTQNRSRRGMVKYEKNPFIKTAVDNIKSGVKQIKGSTSDRMMVLNQNSGEVIAGGVGFVHYAEVDKTQFIKLYVNGVKAIKELTSAGTKVFEILFREVQKNKESDEVWLAFNLIDQEDTPISESTFYRGMKEIIEKKFIAESNVQNRYFLNPDFIFNGNKMTFVKAYMLKENENIPKVDFNGNPIQDSSGEE